MGQSAQNSNPWGGYSRGPAGTVGPGSGVSPGGPSVTQPGSIDPRFTNGGYNPNGNVNPWSGFGNRGAGGGTTAPGSGVSPGGPSVTQPGTYDPTIGLETGGPTPYTPPGNPTLQTGGMTPFQTTTPQLGSMNRGMGSTTPYAGQASPMSSGPGQFYGQRNGQNSGGAMSSGGDYYQDPRGLGMSGGRTQGGIGGPPPGGGGFGNQALEARGNYGAMQTMPGDSYQGQMGAGRNALGSQPMDDQGYVKSLYSGLLGRDASADEVSNASQALTGQYGGDRNKLADFFRGSSEYQAKGPSNIYSGPGSGMPYDPQTPGYRPGAGDQTMRRQWAMQDGRPLNSYMGNNSPMWGNEQQSWEPSRPQTNSLSEMLRQYRGY